MDLLNIEREMATRIEYRVKQAIGAEYPKLNFTTEVSDVPPNFPNVYVHEERLTEAGEQTHITCLSPSLSGPIILCVTLYSPFLKSTAKLCFNNRSRQKGDTRS